jgi:hypothetical protein
VKEERFKNYLLQLLEDENAIYPIDTTCIDITNANTNSNTNTTTNSSYSNKVNYSSKKETRHKYGEYKHVLLTDKQYQDLCEEYGDIETGDAIRRVDEYCEQSGKTYKNYSLVIKKWGYDGKKTEKPDPMAEWRELHNDIARNS